MKKIFFIYSSLPLFWITAALLGSRLGIRFIDPCLWWLFAAYYFYYYVGLVIEGALALFLLYKRKISILQSIIGIALTLTGILVSYYCDAHNTWNVSGWLSD